MKLALVFALGIWTIMSGLVTVQAIWPFDQGNSSQGTNQTGNQTGNQSLSPVIPGQPGGTPGG